MMKCPSDKPQASIQFERLQTKVIKEQGGYTIEVYSVEANKIITRTFIESGWIDGVIALSEQEVGE